ncbi:ACSS3-like protein [Mya arenaria]|uniref:acetate--CoA ligase n=1 Tax=Mya arenaria TaxID=6604 RepID=A0ABY7E230_MYAAR|nr:ACSS3-like protein [Mya arenaria]
MFQTGMHVSDDEIKADIIRHVRDSIGPVASFKLAILVPKLPKTRSGKIARNTIASMAAGKAFQIPPAIEDASVYEEIRNQLEKAGFTTGKPEIVPTD